MKKILILSAIAICSSSFSYGQGEIDAIRFSKNDLTGTARGIAMGGAFGALGGDITGISINPAGLGIYRSSEIVGTMNFSSTNIKTNWNGTSNSESKFKFNFDNLSYVGYFPTGNESMPCFNFSFAYNRLKNFDRNFTASGRGMATSLTDYLANISNGIPVADLSFPKLGQAGGNPYFSGAPWMSVLAYQGHLINARPDGLTYYPPEELLEGDKVDPRLNVSERGAIDTYDFSLGTNVQEKLYLGLTFSFTDLSYSLSSVYSENFPHGATNGFDLYNDLTSEGSGYQLSVGAIYRPTDALRIGVSYHSPTWYSMTDRFIGEVNYDDATGTGYTALTPDDGIQEYKFRSPYHWTFSLASIIGSRAILSLDYEITDYRGMNLKDQNGYEFPDPDNPNVFISQDFKTASTVRAGIEYRVTPQLSARAGYAWMQNPYEKNFREGKIQVMTSGTIPHYTLEGDASHFTCGLGYRITQNFYVDAAFVYRTQSDDIYYYSKFINTDTGQMIVDSTPAKSTNNMYKGVLTLGYKF